MLTANQPAKIPYDLCIGASISRPFSLVRVAALDKSQEQEIGVLLVGFGLLFLGC